MSKMVYPCLPELADSTIPFQPQELIVLEMGHLFASGDSGTKLQLPYLIPWTRFLTIDRKDFCILIVPQLSGKFVARTSTTKFNATGQGNTEDEALQDIKDAIESLIEEEANPSGDVTWPEDCR